MKKLILIGLLIVGLSLPLVANAGTIFYEKGDLTIGIENASAIMLYDFKEAEVLAGMKSSIVQWKELNFDIGLIGEYDELSEADVFVGISADVNALKFKDNIYSSVGVFASPGFIDSGTVRYGAYAGIEIKF